MSMRKLYEYEEATKATARRTCARWEGVGGVQERVRLCWEGVGGG